MYGNRKGSITLVASLSITILSAFLMSMLELGRVTEMQKIAKMSTDSAAESLFANYQKTLWDQYHLLGLEAGDSTLCSKSKRTGYLKDLVEAGLYASGKNRGSLFQSSVQSAELTGINYFTDQSGRVYEAAVSAYMGNNIGTELYNQVSSLSKEVSGYENSDQDVDGKIDAAADLLGLSNTTNPCPSNKSSQKKQAGEMKQAGLTKQTEQIRAQSNPIAEVSDVKADGILTLVLKSGTKISGKEIDTSDSLLRRDFESGDGESLSKSIYQEMATLVYSQEYLSSYQNPLENRALDYELEYVIAGKDSDEANLKSVVLRIFAIREVANFLYAIKDTAMVSTATSIGTAISVATWQPWAKDVVKYGILAAWAYAESILDLRALMDGKKVSLYKNSTQWTSRLSNLPSLLSGHAEAKECKNGIDYQTYLMIFLFMESTRKRAYRSLDVMEATVRLQEGRDDFCINNVMLEAELSMVYQYRSVFTSLKDVLRAEAYSKYSYRKAGT